RTDTILARLDDALADEPRTGLDHAYTEAGEALDGIIRGDLRDHSADVVADALPIDIRRDRLDAEAPAGAYDVRAFSCGEQCLRRHPAIVEAIAAHLVLLDQHHASTERGASGGNAQSTGSRADDAEIGRDHIGLAGRKHGRCPSAASGATLQHAACSTSSPPR